MLPGLVSAVAGFACGRSRSSNHGAGDVHAIGGPRRLRPKIGRPKNLISRAPRRLKIASGAEPAESGTGAVAGPRGVSSSETGSSSPRRVASPDLGVVEEVKEIE